MGDNLFLITIGDPAGIGPEIVLKSFLHPQISHIKTTLVIGSAAVLKKTNQMLNLPLEILKVSEIPNEPIPNTLLVWDLDNVDMPNWKPGAISAAYGHAAMEYIETAVLLAKTHGHAALITAPIHKPALRQAGITDPGHTEILQRLCDAPEVMTMFVVEKMRVFFYTRHLSLAKAIAALSSRGLAKMLERMDQYLRALGFEQPRLALAALNPHASDNGLFGTEEEKILKPAVALAQECGLQVQGPIPADCLFHQALQGKYDAVLSLYHDQGHIACKTYDFERTISVTLGLPFLRTSVDHGTAMDIAGQGIANAVSMEQAILQAAELIQQ